mmetsp:Transcript_28281/g.71499  ORF Transcript_28281/g.71499 Transcript_28281/m.71499 type:complete len:215 (+) Transcript_28281:515-1159(+)
MSGERPPWPGSSSGVLRRGNAPPAAPLPGTIVSFQLLSSTLPLIARLSRCTSVFRSKLPSCAMRSYALSSLSPCRRAFRETSEAASIFSSSAYCVVVKRVFLNSTFGFSICSCGWPSGWKDIWFLALKGHFMSAPCSSGWPFSSARAIALCSVLCSFSASSIHHCLSRFSALSFSTIFSKAALSSDVNTRWKSSKRILFKSTVSSRPSASFSVW